MQIRRRKAAVKRISIVQQPTRSVPEILLPAVGNAPTPIYINNFNRLTTTRRLCEYLDGVPNVNVIIIDNASSYGPLVEWYRSSHRNVIRLSANLGHRAPWTTGIVDQSRTPYYVVTDSDLDLEKCPTDLIERLREGLRRYPNKTKSGLSLEINDLPNSPYKKRVIEFESRYWRRRLDKEFFDAGVDTTFALYLTGRPASNPRTYGNAIRSDRPYTARHMPWYTTASNITAEEKYYLSTASRRISTMVGWTNHGLTLQKVAQ